MIWFYDIRDRHVRGFVLVVLCLTFISVNWGYTIEGINHVVLTVRTAALDTIDGELAEAIGQSIIPFGATSSNLIIIALLWVGFDRLLKFVDIDGAFFEDEFEKLKQDNDSMLLALSATNEQLSVLNQTLNLVTGHNSGLERHKDRLLELGIEREKLLLKTSRAIEPKAPVEEKPLLDLFTKPKAPRKFNNKAPPRRRFSKSAPKF